MNTRTVILYMRAQSFVHYVHTVNGGTCRIQYVNNNRIDKDTVRLTAVHVAISHTYKGDMHSN